MAQCVAKLHGVSHPGTAWLVEPAGLAPQRMRSRASLARLTAGLFLRRSARRGGPVDPGESAEKIRVCLHRIDAVQGGKNCAVVRMGRDNLRQPRVATGVIALFGVFIRFFERHLAKRLQRLLSQSISLCFQCLIVRVHRFSMI